MRVQGEKRRVVLSAEDLEPSEAKPSLRIAPLAALCVWLGSTLIATAIYFEWLPARALFQSTPSVEPAAARPVPARKTPSERLSQSTLRHQAPQPTQASANSHKSAESPRVTKTRSKPEPARVIRGSPFSDTHWAAGW